MSMGPRKHASMMRDLDTVDRILARCSIDALVIAAMSPPEDADDFEREELSFIARDLDYARDEVRDACERLTAYARDYITTPKAAS